MFVSALNNERSFSMQVRDAGSTSDDAWRKVWGKEAAAINPLAAVNHGRNNLILESIRTNDWSDYHNFQAKQHPAWYDKINGEFKQNKMYYGNLIDGQHRSLKEAIQSGDQTEIVKRQGRLDELIADFKKLRVKCRILLHLLRTRHLQQSMESASQRMLGIIHLITMPSLLHKVNLKSNIGTIIRILLTIQRN